MSQITLFPHDNIADVSEWNQRYLAYARAHLREPEAMLAHDGEAWPGGRMAGFTIWIQRRWREWRKLRRMPERDPLYPNHHEAFDFWLSSGAPTVADV